LIRSMLDIACLSRRPMSPIYFIVSGAL
jgi:hypothetical protein